MAGSTSVSAALDRLRALTSQGQDTSPASGQRRSMLGHMVTAPLVDTSDSPTRRFPQVTPPWARAPGAAATSPNSASGTPRSPSLRSSGASTPSSALAPTLGRRPGSVSRGGSTAVRPGGPLQRRTQSNPDVASMAAPSDLVSRAMAGYDSQTPTGRSPTGSAVLPSLPPVPASEAPSDIVARALAKYGAAKEAAAPAPEPPLGLAAPTTRDSGFFPPQAYGAAPQVEKGPCSETIRSPESPEDLLTPVQPKEDSPPGSPPVSDGGSHHGSVGSESTAFPGSVRGASEDPVKEPLPKLGKALQVEEVQQQQQEAVVLEAQRVAAEKKVAEIMAEEPTQEPDIHDSWLPSERLRWRGADRQLPREQRLFTGPRHVVLTAALAFGLAAAGAALGRSQANAAFVQRGQPAGMRFLAKPRPRAARRV